MGADAAMILTAGQATTGFISQRKQASATLAQGRYAQAQFNTNADIEREQAQAASDAGFMKETQSRIATRRLEGAQRAGAAAGGINTDSGSAEQVRESTAELGELDALTIRYNAAREAWGHDVQAADFVNRGAYAMTAARNQASALDAQSWMTLLTGAGQIGGEYEDWKNAPRIARTKPGGSTR